MSYEEKLEYEYCMALKQKLSMNNKVYAAGYGLINSIPFLPEMNTLIYNLLMDKKDPKVYADSPEGRLKNADIQSDGWCTKGEAIGDIAQVVALAEEGIGAASKVEKTAKVTSEVDEAAKVTSKAGKITKGVSKVDETTKVASKAGKITKGASKVDEAAKVTSKAGKITKGVSKVDEAAKVTSKVGKITEGASKVNKPAKIVSEDDSISKATWMEKSVYIPKNENGELISLKKQRLMGQDIPLPDKKANGRPHTVLGGKVSSKTGEVYRQSATFNGGSWPTANGQEVPLSEVHWTNHGRANVHSNPHQHVFRYDFDNRYWYRSDPEILN